MRARRSSRSSCPGRGQDPEHRTGQYVAIAVDLPAVSGSRGSTRSPPGREAIPLRVTISVSAASGHPDGQVSNWPVTMRNPVVLDVLQPCGDLVLDESDGPLVLVSAGIGSPDRGHR